MEAYKTPFKDKIQERTKWLYTLYRQQHPKLADKFWKLILNGRWKINNLVDAQPIGSSKTGLKMFELCHHISKPYQTGITWAVTASGGHGCVVGEGMCTKKCLSHNKNKRI